MEEIIIRHIDTVAITDMQTKKECNRRSALVRSAVTTTVGEGEGLNYKTNVQPAQDPLLIVDLEGSMAI